MSTWDHHQIDEVEDRADASLEALFALIEGAGLQERSLGEAYLGRRGADVVAHLHGWHELFIGWSRAHHDGEPVVTPAEGYAWDNLDALNDAIYEKYAATPYEDLKMLARESRRDMFTELRRFDEHQATTPGAVAWWKASLLELADECGATHDVWAVERINAAIADA